VLQRLGLRPAAEHQKRWADKMERGRKVEIALVAGLLVAGVPGTACADPMCHSFSCDAYFFGLWTTIFALPFWVAASIVAASLSRYLRRLRPHLWALPFALIGGGLFILGLGLSDNLPLAWRFSKWVLVVDAALAAVPSLAWYLAAARRARAAAQPAVPAARASRRR
jgi:hypothetical protein